MPKNLIKNHGLKVHAITPNNSQKSDWLVMLEPWMAGVGIAVGHVLTSSNCSIPKQGSCSACGSCVVALGSLTAWAVLKQRNSDQPFYEEVKRDSKR